MQSTQTKEQRSAPVGDRIHPTKHANEGWLRNFLAAQALAIIAIVAPLALVAFSIAAERALAGL